MFNGDRVSVWNDENILWMDDGGGYALSATDVCT